MGLGRALGLIGTVVTLAVGMYIYSLQVKTLQPSSAGAPSEETATITGVKLDLIGIANAERGYVATQGKYASMDDLISGGYLTTRRERPTVYLRPHNHSRRLQRDGHAHHQRLACADVGHRDHGSSILGVKISRSRHSAARLRRHNLVKRIILALPHANFLRASFITYFLQHLVQQEHKWLQLPQIIGLFVDVSA